MMRSPGVGAVRVSAVRVGAILWVAQVMAFPVEWVTIAMVSAPYSLIDNTLSDLGAVGCGTVGYPGVDVAVCSPAHALFNAALFIGAVAVAVGAILLRPALGPPRSTRLVATGVVFILIAQLSGAATALVPIDVDIELHALVSTATFLAQPLGLLLIGVAGRRNRQWWGLPILITGAATLCIGILFILRLDPAGGGLLERVILWPGIIAFVIVGADTLRHIGRTQVTNT